ncbi:MAG TPA: SDR family NAD(P)-dependent oxidoreductase [Blastocatellia bacterium]|nr:SDR family NAD(P)-dependent oxidoreductase [Blastocatellia bacterium]
MFKMIAAGAGVLIAARAIARRGASFSFRDRVVLITGGSRGLGLVMARELAREGARLAICSRDEQELARARDELAGMGADVLAIPCDVSDRSQVEEMIRSAEDYFGRIDVLVNNAGVIEVGPMDVMTLQDYEESMKIHFWGPLYATLAALPGMRRRGEGRIVNISSIGGKISVPHLLPYSASKFALTGLSEGLRAELAADGIVVTTVCPGLMRTGSPYNADFKGRHRQEFAWFSISDSLPLITTSAERAARQVIAACRRGDAEIVLTVPAKLAALFHGIFPGLTADLLGMMNKLLPEPGGIGEARAKGKDSASPVSPSWLTTLSDRAAAANNEL